jgi:hypothetical protein
MQNTRIVTFSPFVVCRGATIESFQQQTTMAPVRKAVKSSSEFIPVSEDQMKLIGGAIMGRDPEGRSEAVFLTRWLSFFGVDMPVVVKVWDMLEVPLLIPMGISLVRNQSIFFGRCSF